MERAAARARSLIESSQAVCDRYYPPVKMECACGLSGAACLAKLLAPNKQPCFIREGGKLAACCLGYKQDGYFTPEELTEALRRMEQQRLQAARLSGENIEGLMDLRAMIQQRS